MNNDKKYPQFTDEELIAFVERLNLRRIDSSSSVDFNLDDAPKYINQSYSASVNKERLAIKKKHSNGKVAAAVSIIALCGALTLIHGISNYIDGSSERVQIEAIDEERSLTERITDVISVKVGKNSRQAIAKQLGYIAVDPKTGRSTMKEQSILNQATESNPLGYQYNHTKAAKMIDSLDADLILYALFACADQMKDAGTINNAIVKTEDRNYTNMDLLYRDVTFYVPEDKKEKVIAIIGDYDAWDDFVKNVYGSYENLKAECEANAATVSAIADAMREKVDQERKTK